MGLLVSEYVLMRVPKNEVDEIKDYLESIDDVSHLNSYLHVAVEWTC